MRRWSLAASVLAVALVVVLGSTASAGSAKKDPLVAYTFTVTITEGQTTTTAFFKSVSGLSMETEVVDFREGGVNETHKIPGRAKWSNIVLKRGFTGVSDSDFMQKWVKAVQSGQDFRKNVTVVIRDRDQNQIGQFDFVRCWPSRWEVGPLYSPRDPASSPRDPASLDAPEDERAVETFELVHEGMTAK